ncbi:hypothetical protein DK10_000005 [Burkholderia cenocepacia]|nr:hypothetical protein DK10_000005 [Burkholderia cenocepacia]
MVLGAWCLVLGAWCLVLGAWCCAWYSVLGTRYSVLGTRYSYSILGTRYSVLGTRYSVFGTQCAGLGACRPPLPRGARRRRRHDRPACSARPARVRCASSPRCRRPLRSASRSRCRARSRRHVPRHRRSARVQWKLRLHEQVPAERGPAPAPRPVCRSPHSSTATHCRARRRHGRCPA